MNQETVAGSDHPLILQPLACNCQARGQDISFRGRVTVVLMIVYRGAFLFVQMAKWGNWIPPQGGVEEHETLIDAALREAREEVGLTPDLIARNQKVVVLGHCVNPIPPERRSGTQEKHLVFLALPVWDRCWPKPNLREVKECVWVENPGHLQSLIGEMAQVRSVKYRAICDAVNRAQELSLVSWRSGIELVH